MIREALELAEKKYIDNDTAQKEWEMAAKGWMPMTPSIMKDFEVPVDTAYHVTDGKGLKQFIKLQGTKKEISAFTKGSDGISNGAVRDAEYLIEIEGVSVFNAKYDFTSRLSRNGYKWIAPSASNDPKNVVQNQFKLPIQIKTMKYLGSKSVQDIDGDVWALNGKDKNKFIKWYFDESKKMITKSLLKDLGESIAMMQVQSFWDSDELFIHTFKIKNIKIIYDSSMSPDEKLERKDLINRIGIKSKYKGVIGIIEVARLGK